MQKTSIRPSNDICQGVCAKYGKMPVVMSKSKTLDKDLFFRALADRTRLRLLHLMSEDEVCVCFFVEILKTNQPKISRHLAYLRRAGIVGARRQGPWMHYRIVEPPDADAARVLKDTLAWLGNDREMQRDRERLVKVCCAPQLPITIQGAPRPASLVRSA
jgi:ArsR family transcriptional regulator, arsenate/arsenite/antimonite-responsive transcriptional repressor